MPEINTISAIRALVQQGKPLLEAKRAIERAMGQGETTVVVESHFEDLIRHLPVCGFIAATLPTV